MTSGLRQRIVTALALAALVIGILFWMPPAAAVMAVAVVVLAGAWEWAGFAGFTTPLQRLGYTVGIGFAAWAAWRFTADPAGLAAFLRLTALWWLLASVWIVFAANRGGRFAAGLAGFAVLVPAAIGLGRLALVEPQGQLLLLFLIVLIAAADVGAYFGGRAFGRHKLAPLVSPGKTWEGFFAGMLGAGVAAWAGAQIFGQPVLPWLAVGLLWRWSRWLAISWRACSSGTPGSRTAAACCRGTAACSTGSTVSRRRRRPSCSDCN